jgi:hypothetical protein
LGYGETSTTKTQARFPVHLGSCSDVEIGLTFESVQKIGKELGIVSWDEDDSDHDDIFPTPYSQTLIKPPAPYVTGKDAAKQTREGPTRSKDFLMDLYTNSADGNPYYHGMTITIFKSWQSHLCVDMKGKKFLFELLPNKNMTVAGSHYYADLGRTRQDFENLIFDGAVPTFTSIIWKNHVGIEPFEPTRGKYPPAVGSSGSSVFPPDHPKNTASPECPITTAAVLDKFLPQFLSGTLIPNSRTPAVISIGEIFVWRDNNTFQTSINVRDAAGEKTLTELILELKTNYSELYNRLTVMPIDGMEIFFLIPIVGDMTVSYSLDQARQTKIKDILCISSLVQPISVEIRAVTKPTPIAGPLLSFLA